MKKLLLAAICFCSTIATSTIQAQQEMGFLEQYSLSSNREKLLATLIPGTEEYFFYHCLHLQTTGKIAEAQATLDGWISQFGITALARQMQIRQMLLNYNTAPEPTLRYLRDLLGSNLGHARPNPDEAATLPNKLDEKLLDWESRLKEAVTTGNRLSQIEDIAIADALSKIEYEPDFRAWIARVQYPHYPRLVETIAKELKQPDSQGFGWATIHRNLTLKQLNELRKLIPNLIESDAFVRTFLTRLKPSDDAAVDDLQVRREYLTRLEAFADELPDSFNSLRAIILFHRLQLDLNDSIFDRDRFLKYIQLPRNMHYVNPEYIQQNSQRSVVQFSVNFQDSTTLLPVQDDSMLIEKYLEHFFQSDKSIDAFAQYLNRDYLKRVFATTKILYGLGDAKTFFSQLTPQQQKELQERVELRFSPSNKAILNPDDKVVLKVDVKNVPQTIIKIYELNTLNLLRAQLDTISTAIDLDGLVANVERTISFDQPAARRHLESIDFPELNGRGAWVIDILGGGQRSRALVQKGQFKSIQSFSDAGHVLKVMDESGKPVVNAKVLLGEREFTPDNDGEITIPFGVQNQQQAIILTDGKFASLERINQLGEEYTLDTNFFVPPQSLLAGSKSAVVLSNRVRCNGHLIPNDVLEDAKLTIEAVDMDGVRTTQTYSGLQFSDDLETTQPFQVPVRLASLKFSLEAKIKNLSKAIRQPVASSHTLVVNQVATTAQIADFYLAKIDGQYRFEVRGRNGEPMRRLSATVMWKLEGITTQYSQRLATDAEGFIHLGTLPRVQKLWISADNIAQREFLLDPTLLNWPSRLNEVVGNPIVLSMPESVDQGTRWSYRFSLLEYRSGIVYQDHRDKIKIANSAITIDKLLPGRYVLTDGTTNASVEVLVTDGRIQGDLIVSPNKVLERSSYVPLRILPVATPGKNLVFRIEGADEQTRVHLIANAYYHSPYSAIGFFSTPRAPGLVAHQRIPSFYLDSMKLDEEYEYVLQRQLQKKYPGNMLAHPSVLLNPWELSITQNEAQVAQLGDELKQMNAPAPMSPAAKAEGMAREFESKMAGALTHEYEFLARGSVVVTNLVPDKVNHVSFDPAGVEGLTDVLIVAVHPNGTTYSRLSLPLKNPRKTIDRQLQKPFDISKHYAERERIRILKAKERTELGDPASTRVRIYGSVSELFTLYLSLLNATPASQGHANHLQQFQFITTWNDLKEGEKRQKYNDFACHELNFFLYHHDRTFFDAVVKPYLTNKFEQQFMDEWLLGKDLTSWKQPWKIESINTAERTLLASRFKDTANATKRWLANRVDANPMHQNPSLRSNRFSIAMLGDALNASSNTADWAKDGRLDVEARDRFALGTNGTADAFFDAGGVGASVELEMAQSDLSAASEMDVKANRDNDSRLAMGRAADKDFGLKRKELNEAKKSKRSLGKMQRLYEPLQATRKWAESQYYRLPIQQQNANWIPTNPFWRDYLKHLVSENENNKLAFLSENLDAATASHSEALFALSVLGLPLQSKMIYPTIEEGKLVATSDHDSIAYLKSIEAIESAKTAVSILIGQDIYLLRPSDETQNKTVQDKPLFIHIPYKSNVVVTNPTSQPQRVQVLIQIPQGAIALSSGKPTKSVSIELAPYSTQQIAYEFYFPKAGKFTHYGAQVSNDDGHIANAKENDLVVLDKPEAVDETTWSYVAAWGTNEQVLNYLEKANLFQIDLNLIAWRMQDQAFFETCLDRLSQYGRYEAVLWAYSLKHNVKNRLVEFLENTPGVHQAVGPAFQSSILTYQPVERLRFEHLDFRPLVVARIHQLGRTKKVLNDGLAEQYRHFLQIVSYQSSLTTDQKLSLVYYMIIQNRTEEAISSFNSIAKEDVKYQLQLDYFQAYLAMSEKEYKLASDIASKYLDHPVPRWKEWFVQIKNHIAYMERLNSGDIRIPVDGQEWNDDNNQRLLSNARESDQLEQANLLPTLDLSVEDRSVKVDLKNIDQLSVNFYLMDIELLFTRNPFVQGNTKRTSSIQPNLSQVIAVEKGKGNMVLTVPDQLKNKNLVVEVNGGGLSRSTVIYANSLSVSISTGTGRLQATTSADRKALGGAYVKVYARYQDGSVHFYKDGYTDLRGQFDYASLSTDDLNQTQRFAILVLDPEHGAIIREADVPKR